MAIEKIAIADLERTKLQTRLLLSAETVEDYADAMRNKAKFPPVTVFADTEANTLWLADGFHRVAAAEADGYKFVKADVRPGSFVDALKHALGANANHGLRRSNADKRHALEMAWENRRELFGEHDPSEQILIETLGISHGLVSRFLADRREELTPKRVTVAGKVYTRPAPVPVRPAPVAKVVPPQRPAPAPYNHAAGVMTDIFGVEVPMEIRDAFRGETARDQIESMLRSAYRLLKGAMEAKDPSVAQFRQADLVDLQNAVRTAKFTKPYCVCRICQGNGRGSCTACHETGFQTQAQYENNPKEFKA